MELQFIDGMELQLDNSCEFELPSYMTKLDPENLAKENGSNLVIAAGADPADGKITLVTVTGRVVIFDARKYYIPDGPAVPSHGGQKIFLMNVNNRWPGQSPGFYVNSEWMLSCSESALTGATLSTNYIHENNSR